MASLGSIKRLPFCICQKPTAVQRHKPGFGHPSTLQVRFCTSPAGPQAQSDVVEEASVQRSTTSTATSVPCSTEWELDFSSRPLVDERGKKVWELVICSPDRSFEYTEYFPNNKINSKELASSIQRLISQEGAEKPRVVKFFRGQMRNIISRALDEASISPLPSRRCFALLGWLDDRLENVYKKDARYSEKTTNLFMLDLEAPKELEDALRGEAWNFVQLPLSTILSEVEDIEKGEIFGATLPLDAAGLGDLPMDTLIPGVSIYSRRAEGLAAWTDGLEISNIRADIDRASLILETGVSERWKYASYVRSDEMTALAMGWEQAKEAARGLHFLAIQEDPDAECCSGLWLLLAAKSNI